MVRFGFGNFRKPVRAVRWNSPGLLAIFVSVFAFYFWTAQPEIRTPVERSFPYYTKLSEAFLAGRLSLLEEPAPQLSLLQDPYDPRQNEPFRMHDASLYKGKYYLYYGPAPALVLFVPFRILTGTDLPDRIGCLYLGFAAYVVSCLVLKLIVTTFFPNTSNARFYFCAVLLAFLNTLPFQLRNPYFYQIAICGGQLFLFAGLYFLFAALLLPRWATTLKLLIGGILLGTAAASRPSLVFAGAAILLFLIFPAEDKWRRAVIFGLGFAIVICGILAYNYARFDSPFEFGVRYQLSGMYMPAYRMTGWTRLGIGLLYLLFCPPHLRSRFPFVTLDPPRLFKLPDQFLLERVEGLLWINPLVLLIPAAGWLTRGIPRRRELLAIIICFVVLGLTFLSISGMLAAVMRYHGDVDTLFTIASFLCGYAWMEKASPRLRPKLLAGFVVVAVLAATSQAAVSIMGDSDRLRTEAPAQFAALEDFFRPLEHLLELFLPAK